MDTDPRKCHFSFFFFLFNSLDSWSSQEDGAQPESFVMVPASSHIIGETSSASTGYFSCASSESELGFSDEDGKEDAEVDSEPGKGVQLNFLASSLLYFLFENKKSQGRGTRIEVSAKGKIRSVPSRIRQFLSTDFQHVNSGIAMSEVGSSADTHMGT